MQVGDVAWDRHKWCMVDRKSNSIQLGICSGGGGEKRAWTGPRG